MQLFNKEMLDELSSQAKISPRLRANRNVHASLEETVQRLFIAIEPGSYVQPHRHPEAEKWEFFMVVRGKIAMIIFNDEGCVVKRIELNPATGMYGLEVPLGTLLRLQQFTLIFI